MLRLFLVAITVDAGRGHLSRGHQPHPEAEEEGEPAAEQRGRLGFLFLRSLVSNLGGHEDFVSLL